MDTGSFPICILMELTPLIDYLPLLSEQCTLPTVCEPPCRSPDVRAEMLIQISIHGTSRIPTLATHCIHTTYQRSPFSLPLAVLFHLEAYSTSLLRSMRQAAVASDPLTVTFLKRWDDHFTPEGLAQATMARGELCNYEAAGICDALRWSVLRGHLQSISSVGVVLVPRGILLHCTATYYDCDSAQVNSHFVPLAMAADPRLFQYLFDHDNPLVTSLVSAWSPAHKTMDTFTLRSSIARMLQCDVAFALSCDRNNS